MYVLNMTKNVDESVETPWLHWVKTTYLPYMMSKDIFSSYKIFELEQVNGIDGKTYVIQLYADSKANYNRFAALHADKLAQLEKDTWGVKVFSFSTLMKSVD